VVVVVSTTVVEGSDVVDVGGGTHACVVDVEGGNVLVVVVSGSVVVVS